MPQDIITGGPNVICCNIYPLHLGLIPHVEHFHVKAMVPEQRHNIKQGMVDGSARKPALRQNTGYMLEKTYHIAPYLGPV